MAVDIVMPQMGESIFEGTITKWLKKPGDKVESADPLFEISTDKVDAEIPSPSAGVLKEIKVGEGQTVPIQTIVGVIDAASSVAAAPAPAPPKPAAAAPVPREGPRPRGSSPATAEARSSCSGRRADGLCPRFSRFIGRADSQFAAGPPHGQGARHRPLRRGGNRRWWANQQTGYRGS